MWLVIANRIWLQAGALSRGVAWLIGGYPKISETQSPEAALAQLNVLSVTAFVGILLAHFAGPIWALWLGRSFARARRPALVR